MTTDTSLSSLSSLSRLSRDDITARVIHLIEEIVGDKVTIKPETQFMTELDIDSLTLVRLDSLIQGHLGLALAADDIADIQTVRDLVDALLTRGQPVSIDD